MFTLLRSDGTRIATPSETMMQVLSAKRYITTMSPCVIHFYSSCRSMFSMPPIFDLVLFFAGVHQLFLKSVNNVKPQPLVLSTDEKHNVFGAAIVASCFGWAMSSHRDQYLEESTFNNYA